MFLIVLELVLCIALGIVSVSLSEKGYSFGKRFLTLFVLFLMGETVIFSIESVFNALPVISNDVAQVLDLISAQS